MIGRKIYALGRKGIRAHFGQNGEDILIKPYLRKFSRAHYLDLGAHHPFRFSNTALLWMNGWNGVNVDANPRSIEIFSKKRKSDTSIHAAIVTHKEHTEGTKEVIFYLDANEIGSSRNQISARGSTQPTRRDQVQIKVPAMTVEEILCACDLEQTEYLNVDLEGIDEKIIREFDFENFRPTVITIEDHQSCIEHVISSPISDYMFAKDYVLVARCFMTSVFAKK
jgi:hypothetical protein